MWVIRNTLRGTLTFRGLEISIPPRGELDLDEVLGRDRAERSNQVIVAFEEGYLQTVQKSLTASSPPEPRERGATAEELNVALDTRLSAFKDSLTEELQALRAQVSGDVGGLLDTFKVAKLKLNEEKRRVLIDTTLGAAEIKARLAYLEEQERELTVNFTEIGRKRDGGDASEGVQAKADLLSSI